MATIHAMLRFVAGSLLLVLSPLTACIGGGGADRAVTSAEANAKAEAERKAPAPTVAPTPEFVEAGEGDVDIVVRQSLQTAEQQQRRLVVYVGATWCEPCQAFHDAVERGELDDALTGVRLLEFDSDRDGARLRDAGYGGRYIPRFVLPNADGRAGEQRMEGGIKGEGAVANIMERLGPLLARG